MLNLPTDKKGRFLKNGTELLMCRTCILNINRMLSNNVLQFTKKGVSTLWLSTFGEQNLNLLLIHFSPNIKLSPNQVPQLTIFDFDWKIYFNDEIASDLCYKPSGVAIRVSDSRSRTASATFLAFSLPLSTKLGLLMHLFCH